MDHQLCRQRAELAGQWALVNQNKRKNSADYGRYPRSFDRRGDEENWASSWLQGVEMMALLALHEATGKSEYLDSCVASARYLRTLQQLDARKPANYGYFVEVTPQDTQGHPRDALTAAWGLLMLHRIAPDPDVLDRVMLFADWFERVGMCGDYPAWTVYMDGKPPLAQRGSFHGGSPAFFSDLYDMTGQRRWLELACKIADFHTGCFLMPDGSLRITVAPDGKTDLTFTGVEAAAWEHMHMFNDDFTALAMMRLGELTGERRYTEAGLRFAGYLLRAQQPNGGFGDPVVTSAGGVGALTLARAAQVDPARRQKYLAAVDRAVDYMLSEQETQDVDPRFRGAFYAELEGKAADWRSLFAHGRSFVHLRTIAYSTSALAMLGGKCRRSYYNVSCGVGQIRS